MRDLLREKGLYLLSAALLFFTLVVLKNAWLAEDAYITFRVVDNFVDGRGLTWNPAERVQVYTHPLWMFLVSAVYWITGEIFYSVLLLSLLVSLVAILLFALKLAPSRAGAILGIAALTCSKSFVDYSTSGLENPLTHLCLLLFLWLYLRGERSGHRFFQLSLTAALCAFNRMDLILLVFPALLFALWRSRSFRSLRAVFLGFSPFLLWLLFALFYYGTPLPNTAYAKLHTGVERSALVLQGLRYLYNALQVDPLTLLIVLAGIVVPFLTDDRQAIPPAAGILFYAGYVVSVGGDFMSGRFLTAPMIMGMALLLTVRHCSPREILASLLLLLLCGIGTDRHPLFTGFDYGNWNEQGYGHGIADERAFYYSYAGLFAGRQDDRLRSYRRVKWAERWAAEAAKYRDEITYVAVADAIGYAGYYAGPDVHILNPLALSDPLLARLLPRQDVEWRIGHFQRPIPEGYIETLQLDDNLLRDERLAAYYDQLALITRGDLFSGERLAAIWNFELGKYDHLIASYDR